MVLTEREYIDVLDNHQLIMIFVKDRAIDQIPYVLLVALSEVQHSFRVSLGGLTETFALGVLTNAF